MWHKVVRDCIFRNSFAKKGKLFFVGEGEKVPRHLALVKGEELGTMPEPPVMTEQLEDDLETLNRQQLAEVAEAEEISLPSKLRNRGDMINFIRKARKKPE